MIDSEYTIYGENLVSCYLTTGCLFSALERCREILPADSELSEKIGICLKKLTSGEGTDKDHPVRESLREMENGDVRISILHDVVAFGEERGENIDEALLFLGEAWEYAPGCNIYIFNGKGMKGSFRKCLSRGKRCVAEVREELPGWMIGMAAYAHIMSFREALRRSSGLTHGFFKKELRTLARQLENDDAVNLIGCFLSELKIPEINMCLSVCMHICDGTETDARGILSACRRLKTETNQVRNNRMRGKGVAVAVFAAVWILIMVVFAGLTDAKKEQHLREALTGAMSVTVGETPGFDETNQMLAVFMQNMLKCVDDDIDLTIRICEMDEKKKTIDVEATGEYDLGFGRRSVSVRRRVAF
ncbi:MAG: hypothetical protein J5819_00660 [Eubacterium sp.]|nr:hypothetical protein [Eubacterium sp.]